MFKLLLFVAAIIASVSSQNDGFIINTTGGQVRGEILSGGLFSSYYSFKGIPYAAAPVDDLRFRAPQPHAGWDGVRDALEHGFNCPSGSLLNSNMNEDCLSLNVYSPNLIGRRAVMVWIHGGSFSSGSGDSFVYGPDHLVDEDVLLVTVNYRLGILGFLSTGDSVAPGNYGMKDIVAALRWIRDNIANFGGDPDNVTVFGESAGGAAVHYLVLSPVARGLFHKAISQSGSALNPWAFQTDPRDMAFQVGRTLGSTATTSEELVAAYRAATIEELIDANPGSMSYPIPRGMRPIPFVPSLDPAGISEEEVFLPGNPMDIILSGNFADVPYITGYTDAESLVMMRELLLDSSVFPTMNANPELLIPMDFNVPVGSAESQQFIDDIRDFYFGGQTLADDIREEWTKYLTDTMFHSGIDLQVQLQSVRMANPTYYYVFSFTGTLNLIKHMFLLNSWPGAVHADDLFYIFDVTRFPPPLLPTNDAITTRRRMVRMWGNFAKTGNPTPSTDLLIVTSRWTQVMGTQEFMDIGRTLTPGRFPHRERMDFWNRARATYG